MQPKGCRETLTRQLTGKVAVVVSVMMALVWMWYELYWYSLCDPFLFSFEGGITRVLFRQRDKEEDSCDMVELVVRGKATVQDNSPQKALLWVPQANLVMFLLLYVTVLSYL